jgi:[ribosomal protein S5]-alanine N-acetyltransferase
MAASQLALHTERLRLLALSRPELALLHNHVRRLEEALAVSIARGMLTDANRRAIARKLAQMQAAPEVEHPWITYWLALTADPARGIGLLGFKGVPDGEGVVEIAYTVDPEHRGQGYATEAARALIAWAFEHASCCAVVAPDTPRANEASSRVLEKLGMRVYATTERARSWRLDKR